MNGYGGYKRAIERKYTWYGKKSKSKEKKRRKKSPL
jgi:hypothetical protein